MKRTILLAAALLLGWQGAAVAGDGEGLLRDWFEPYAPMYFSAGIPLSEAPAADNTDVKFRLSFRKTLWSSGAVQLYGSYTQTSIWDLFADSSPFYDNWYNPALHLSWELPASGNLLRAGLEHKSNGRDGELSRSTNNLYAQYIRNWSSLSLQAKVWYGFGYLGDDVYDVMSLFGFCSFSAIYSSPGDIFSAAVTVTPTNGFRRADIGLEMYCRLGRSSGAPCLFVECSYGRDAMRDFIPDLANGSAMLRLGISFKPQRFFCF